MADRYTEVTRTGWGKRIGQSLSGALIGGLLFLASFVLLWWNEGRAIGEARALAEGAGAVVDVGIDAVDPEPEIARYLREQWGISEFTVEDREAGISPMTEQPFARREGHRVRRIGVPAGRLKASTGYALTRILDDTRAIVASLVARGHPFDAPADRRGYRLLDAVLLELWDARPARMPAIFRAMFARSPGDRILRFLDERASAGDLLKIVLSLPFLPFLFAALRWLLRRAGLVGPPRALPP